MSDRVSCSRKKALTGVRTAPFTDLLLLGVSHDLRSPATTGLYLLRELLAGEPALSSEAVSKLRLLENSLEAQLEILDDLLEALRPDSAPEDTEGAEADLSCLLPTLRRYGYLARQEGVLLLSTPFPARNIRCKPRHLVRIVENLLANALRHTQAGRIAVTFRELPADLEIEVADTGSGVPEGLRDRLFAGVPKQRGSSPCAGLGLLVVRTLAEANGGEPFYRAEKRGSVFGVRFPCSASVCRAAKRRMQVLVVDDDPQVRRFHQRVLSSHGAATLAAATPAEAESMLQQTELDIVITDLNFGGLLAVGFVTDLVRASMPVLLLTGADERFVRDRLHEPSPCLRVLRKPVAAAELLQAVEDCRRAPSFQTSTVSPSANGKSSARPRRC